MMQINCPCCGKRDETEFIWGGEANLVRPLKPDSLSDNEWGNYLYIRKNPKGLHHERWCHMYGCGQWFNLVRDTVSHEIRAVYPIGGSVQES